MVAGASHVAIAVGYTACSTQGYPTSASVQREKPSNGYKMRRNSQITVPSWRFSITSALMPVGAVSEPPAPMEHKSRWTSIR